MKSVRSFIAIECPEGIKKAIQNIQQDLRTTLEASEQPPSKSEPPVLPGRARGVRALENRSPHGPPPIKIGWVRPEGFHLTLKFLGHVTEDRLPKVVEAVGGVVTSFSLFTVSVGGVGVFPNTRVPRVIWIGVKTEGDILASLQSRVEEVLDPLGFPRENRSFHPHLTLGRIKSESREVDFRQSGDTLAKWLAENQHRVCGQFEVKEVLLMKSDLQPSGAVYTPLATLRLSIGLGRAAL